MPDKDVARAFRFAHTYPYDGKPAGRNPARLTALAILDDLGGRSGIKHELESVDLDIREEIVASLTTIIRHGMAKP